MNTLSSVEFLRLRGIMHSMTSLGLITKEEANAMLTKTGYVIISDTEFHAPDGSVIKIYENK